MVFREQLGQYCGVLVAMRTMHNIMFHGCVNIFVDYVAIVVFVDHGSKYYISRLHPMLHMQSLLP